MRKNKSESTIWKTNNTKRKCAKVLCIFVFFFVCLSLWRLSDLQIRTGKKNRKKNKNKLRQNVLHSGVLLLFVSVLFSGDSGRGSQICTFPWRKKTVVKIKNETRKETKKRNEIHSTRTRRVFVFFCADMGSPNLWRKNANRKQNTTKMQITLAHFGFCFFFASFCGGWEWGWWCVVCFYCFYCCYCFCSVWLILSKVQDGYTGSNLLFPV